MNHETITDGFKNYIKVFPEHDRMHPSQKKELRRAFFAGSVFILSALLKAAGEEGTEPGEEMLSRFWKELEGFKDTVKEGHA
jgi:hypothetical protein